MGRNFVLWVQLTWVGGWLDLGWQKESVDYEFPSVLEDVDCISRKGLHTFKLDWGVTGLGSDVIFYYVIEQVL